MKAKLRKHNIYPMSQQELDALIGSGIKIKKIMTVVDVEITKYNILIDGATFGSEDYDLLVGNKDIMEKLKVELQEAVRNGKGIKIVPKLSQ